MLKNIIGVCFIIFLMLPLSIHASSGNKKQLTGSYPIVLAHGGLGFGEGNDGIGTFLNYWGNIPAHLRSHDVSVLVPDVSTLHSSEERSSQLRDQILVWMAAHNYSKVNIVGHSNAALDTRFMVSPVGLPDGANIRNKVSVITTINGDHHGIPLLDWLLTMPDGLQKPVTDTLNFLFGLIWGSKPIDSYAGAVSMSAAGMQVFNDTIDDNPNVKYYSYGGKITSALPHLLGALYLILNSIVPDQGLGRANDGLIPYESQKYGIWMGGPERETWNLTGIDHLEAVDFSYSGQLLYDVEGFYLRLTKNAMANQ